MFFTIFFIFLLLAAITCATLLSITDFRRRIIPDAYLFPLMLIGLTLVVFYGWPIRVTDATIGAVFGYILSTTIGFIFDWHMRRKDSNAIVPIGMGDIKLISIGGLWMGTTGLSIALFIACIGGAIWARTQNQRYIPFGPFFVIGAILSLLVITFLL